MDYCLKYAYIILAILSHFLNCRAKIRPESDGKGSLKQDLGCTGVICQYANVFYDLVTVDSAKTALSCEECFGERFRTCLWNNHSSQTQNTYGVCLHSVPPNCSLTTIADEMKDEHGYSICYRQGIKLKPLDKLIVDSADRETITLIVPNLSADAYWRPLLKHITQVEFFVEYPPSSNCFGGSLVENASTLSERLCSRIIKILNKDEFMVTQDFVNRYRTEIFRNELPVAEDFENPNRPVVFLRFRILFSRKRQLQEKREQFRLLTIKEMTEPVRDKDTPEFDVNIQFFNVQSHSDQGKDKGSESSKRTTILLIVFIVLIAIVTSGLFIYFYKKRRAGKKGLCWLGQSTDITYSYVPVKNELNTGGQTKLEDLTLEEQTDVLLDEKGSELTEYYELLAQCAMFTVPRLDIQEVIGQGSFAPARPIRRGHFYDSNIDVMVLNVTTPCLQSKDELQDFLPAFRDSVLLSKHPNTISLLGACDQDDRLLICLDLPSGPNMQTALRESRTLGTINTHLKEFAIKHKTSSLFNAQKLFSLMIGVARGVAHLEQSKVTHPQLAAIHICMGDGGVPKIAEFGMATASQLYTRESEQKHSNLRWCAPELLGDPPSWPNAKSQVYSLSTVFWEICSIGGTPYWDENNSNICQLVCAGTPPERISYMSEKLYDTLCLGWDRSGNRRPSASEMLQKVLTLAETPKDHFHLSLDINQQFDYVPFNPDMENVNDMSFT